MSEKIKDINKNIMEKIHEGKIKMKPRYYFIFGATLTFVGFLASVILSILASSLLMFILRARGPRAGYRLEMMLNNFPWWLIIVAILGLFLGFCFMKKYDFSYKLDYKKSILILVLTILLAGWTIDILGFNNMLMKRGPMKGMMKRYMHSDINEDFSRDIEFRIKDRL